MTGPLASIPSPGTNTLSIGPLDFRLYGMMIALGVVAAVLITQRRWTARGGAADDISAIAVWAVPAGIVGARIYHVLTDLGDYTDDPVSALYIWQGGLGIWGAIAGGIVGGWFVARQRGLDVVALLDAVVPGLLVAQAIGRLGNWFNRELFGRPTELPWGLEIPAGDRPPAFLDAATFHPTFAYEALWNLALAGVLVLVARRWTSARPGSIFGLYVAGYCAGRVWIEMLRIDPAQQILGQRLNVWTSILVGGAAVAWLALANRGRSPATRSSDGPTTGQTLGTS